ncbi:MAG: CHAP domain-containing protein, partial [Caulobacteraceae bacterium]
GQIEKNVTVVDVSPGGDWTQVKVWYDPLRDLGTTVYPTHGFIYQQAMNQAPNAARDAAYTVVRTAASHVASALQPGSNSPVQTIARVSQDSSDRIGALIAQVTGSGDDEK